MTSTNKKNQGRQTNNSLSSMTEHIVISPETANSASEPSRKKKTVTNNKLVTGIFTETDEVLQIGMHKVLEHIKNHDDAWPFMDPVEEDIAPRYYSIIRRPMDLQKMEEKLDSAEYNSFTDFKNDFKLIVNNCRLYNGQNNEYTEMVNNLQIAFEKATRKYFDHNSSDEETFFDYLDVKHDAFHEKVLSEKIKNKKLLQIDMESESDFIHLKKKYKNIDDKNIKDNKQIGHKCKQTENNLNKIIIQKNEIVKNFKEQQTVSNKIENKKIDYAAIESSLKKKDRKKIMKEIKKKHKSKGKLKGKLKKERGRPKGSHKVDKLTNLKILDLPLLDDNDYFDKNENSSEEIDTFEKKHKKSMHKHLKKEKKSKHKDINKKYKKHPMDNDDSLDESSNELENDQDLILGYSTTTINKNKEKNSESKRDQKLKKKIKKKTKKTPEEIAEKRKPGRPKTKHINKTEFPEEIEYKKQKKNKQKYKPHDSETKKKKGNVTENSDTEASEYNIKENSDFVDSYPYQSLTPDIIDKYDLIKQRRRQKQGLDKFIENSSKCVPDDKSAIKNYESADEALSKTENKKSQKCSIRMKNSLSAKEPKNQRLQETIEKLKKKSKKNKKENELLDEIFGVKPTKQIDDEKSVYKKIRETYGGEKDLHNKAVNTTAHEIKNISEYDFIDDFVVSKKNCKENPTDQKKSPNEHCFITPIKKKEQALLGKFKSGIKSNKQCQSSIKKNEKANMEALELETEQTLKDINKWLELTPHMAEFGSASSSPSRYIIDELDTVPTRTDDFIRSVPILQENQENDQSLNSQFDTLKNDTKVGLHDHNITNKQAKMASLNNEQKPLKLNHKSELKARKTTKLLNYVPSRKRDHHRTIDRLPPGKSKGNLLNSINSAKKSESEMKSDIITSKVKEIKNSLIVQTNESGPKLSLGTVLDSEGFGIIQQHNFQDDNPPTEDNDEKPADHVDTLTKTQDEKTLWRDITKTDGSYKSCESINEQIDEDKNDKKIEELKPNLSAWFKAFGIPKKHSVVSTSALKDGTCGESVSQSPAATNNLPQPTMRQRKSSTGSTTSELSSVSQDPDSPRITIDESYTSSYKSPLQLPIVTSPKAGDFSPRQQAMSTFEINGPIKVGFYQDTTKCSPDKSPQDTNNTSQQYSMSHRTPPNSGLPTSLQHNFSYYTKTDCAQLPSNTNTLFVDTLKKRPECLTQDNSNDSPNNPNSPYQKQPTSPYSQNPHSPFTNQSSHDKPPSFPTNNLESKKVLYTHDKSACVLQPEKILSSNVQKRMEPPSYSNTPQFSLSNLQKSCDELSKKDLVIPENENVIASHFTNTSISSTSNDLSNIKSSNEQSTWPPQGLYGPNTDKSLFPLSLTNTTADNSQTQSNNNPLSQNQTESVCNNQTYNLFEFDMRQKKQVDCMSSTATDAVSLVAKNQEPLRKQQTIVSANVYGCKTPLDYANIGSDRYKRVESFTNKNTNSCHTFGTQSRPQSKPGISHTHISKQYAEQLQHQQHMFSGNRTNYLESEPVDLKSSALPQTSHPKQLDGNSQFNTYGNNYMTHGQQGQNSSTDYTMTGPGSQNVRYTDLSRQTPSSHPHSQMDAYKNTAYMRNFASIMAEMGLPNATQNPYSQSMAHQFAKSFHQATTAALQQFLPGSSMTTTAYSKGNREDEIRPASSKSFPPVTQQNSSSPVLTQYISGNNANQASRDSSLTSQQQQHMATYQQKFSEAANILQGSSLSQGHSLEIKQTSTKKSVKSNTKKNKQSSQLSATTSQSELLLNSGMSHGPSSYQSQTIPSAHNFSSYSSNNASGKPSDNTTNTVAKGTAVAGNPGSAFNFTPTAALSLPGPPPGLYGETPSYLEDFRGTTNPYYPIASSTNHRNSTEIIADKSNPGNTSTVSTPYPQFLPHPSSRSGYPFMNPASFDPLQQQWNLREDQLRAQMMLASNPYSQSGFPRHLWG